MLWIQHFSEEALIGSRWRLDQTYYCRAPRKVSLWSVIPVLSAIRHQRVFEECKARTICTQASTCHSCSHTFIPSKFQATSNTGFLEKCQPAARYYLEILKYRNHRFLHCHLSQWRRSMFSSLGARPFSRVCVRAQGTVIQTSLI